MSENLGAFNKILNHPDKEIIMEKLLNGESLKNVEAFLKKKYPTRKRYHVSWITLQRFRKEHLNLHGEVLEDLKQIKNQKVSEELTIEKSKILSKSQAYQEKLSEIVDTEIDASRRLLEMDKLVNSRIIHYFNLLNSGEGAGIKEDKVLLEYMKEYRAILESWKKFIEGHADKTVEHNININVVNEQIGVIKGVIFEVISELDPALVPIFVDKLNYKMAFMNPAAQDYKRLTVIDSEDI